MRGETINSYYISLVSPGVLWFNHTVYYVKANVVTVREHALGSFVFVRVCSPNFLPPQTCSRTQLFANMFANVCSHKHKQFIRTRQKQLKPGPGAEDTSLGGVGGRCRGNGGARNALAYPGPGESIAAAPRNYLRSHCENDTCYLPARVQLATCSHTYWTRSLTLE